MKRQGTGFDDYGLVDARAVKRQRGNGGGANDGPVSVALLEEYELFVSQFRTAVHDHSDGSSLDLGALSVAFAQMLHLPSDISKLHSLSLSLCHHIYVNIEV